MQDIYPSLPTNLTFAFNSSSFLFIPFIVYSKMGISLKKRGVELTDAQRATIWALHKEGYTPVQIATKTPHPSSTITQFIRRHTESGSTTFESKPRSGRPKKITERGARALLRTACNDTRMTLKGLATPSKSGQQLNHHTVAIILKSFGKAKRRPRKKPFLTLLHKKKRRIHCRAEKALGRDNRKVCWSDEVTFEVGEDMTTFYVTRGAGREEEYADKNLRPTFKSGRTTVGVWSCFCGDEMGPLYILPDGENMTAKRYHWVLQTKFIPFYNRMKAKYGKEVVMQEDNAPWHTAKIITKYLNNKRINRMNWPPQSPDLNPIENLWKYIKDLIAKRKHRCRNAADLRCVLKDVWLEIDSEYLLKLCDSVPRRWDAVLKSKGGATKY
jgi:transposase